MAFHDHATDALRRINERLMEIEREPCGVADIRAAIEAVDDDIELLHDEIRTREKERDRLSRRLDEAEMGLLDCAGERERLIKEKHRLESYLATP